MEKKGSVTIKCDINDFKDALEIWCIKPQVINRRLVGCKQIFSGDTQITNLEQFIIDIFQQKQVVSSIMTSNVNSVSQCLEIANSFLQNISSTSMINVVLRKLISKCKEKQEDTYELCCSCNDNCNVTHGMIFIPLTSVSDGKCHWLVLNAYGVIFDKSQERLDYYMHVSSSDNDESSERISNSLVISTQWFVDVLVKKLKSWAEVSFQSDTSLRKDKSLSHIDIEEYSNVYNTLKSKYAPYFLQIWPESTDPLKFVYEDIGIAAYLLVMWKSERDKKNLTELQSFVDLGCGNGLLVYILASEGHKGRGIDINSRKIWNMYSSVTLLQEEALQPETFLASEDWIIGNHSDELTPWIPVIAARSGVNYFVLPCCFFDFFSKFKGLKQKRSQYEVYLDFVKHIGTDLGFSVKQDTLRIPSTKKVCLIGQDNVNRCDTKKVTKCINILLENSKQKSSKATESNESFLPRIVSNQPRNCSGLPFDFKNFVISKVAEHLLARKDIFVAAPAKKLKEDSTTSKGYQWNVWNPGGKIPLKDLVSLFDKETLKKMKCQCGGLQTLLKNYGHVFKVVKGEVCLRDLRFSENFRQTKTKSAKVRVEHKKECHKTKICWFHFNHPQGCVLSDDLCTYIHHSDDVK